MSLVNKNLMDDVASWDLLRLEYTITSGMTVSITHGLSSAPYDCRLALRNITAELGYTVGDEVLLGTASAAAAASGVTIAVNPMLLKLKMLVLPVILNLTTGAATAITAANWNLVIYAQAAP